MNCNFGWFEHDSLRESCLLIDQVNNLRDSKPILCKKYVDGEILIVGALYDTHTGKLEFLQETLLNLPKPKSKSN